VIATIAGYRFAPLGRAKRKAPAELYRHWEIYTVSIVEAVTTLSARQPIRTRVPREPRTAMRKMALPRAGHEQAATGDDALREL
jgi:hypothetical protein